MTGRGLCDRPRPLGHQRSQIFTCILFGCIVNFQMKKAVCIGIYNSEPDCLEVGLNMQTKLIYYEGDIAIAECCMQSLLAPKKKMIHFYHTNMLILLIVQKI